MPARREPGVNRAAILAAGYESIATRGYQDATTAAICHLAGVSSGTFFHYFPTKQDLLLALLDEHEPPPPDQTVHDIVTNVLEEVSDPLMPAFVREVSTLSQLPQVQAVLTTHAGQRRTRLRAAVTRGHTDKSVRTDVSIDDLVLRLEVVLDGLEAVAATRSDLDLERLTEAAEGLVADVVAPST